MKQKHCETKQAVGLKAEVDKVFIFYNLERKSKHFNSHISQFRLSRFQTLDTMNMEFLLATSNNVCIDSVCKYSTAQQINKLINCFRIEVILS